MPSRLAALKVQLRKGTKSGSSLRQAIHPGVGFIQDTGKKPVLQHSNTSLSTASSETAVSTPASSRGPEKVVLQLAAGTERPSVPYKLRFTLSSQEWDERIECISHHREHSAQPYREVLWFLLVFAQVNGLSYT